MKGSKDTEERTRKICLLIVLIVASQAVLVCGSSALNPDFGLKCAGTVPCFAPYGVAIGPNLRQLFICDSPHNRVLRFDTPLENITADTPPSLVFGQPDLMATTAGVATMSGPLGITVDKSGRLWVADSQLHRVLWFDNAENTTFNQQTANGVLGQPDLSGFNPGAGKNGLSSPYGVWRDERGTRDGLWVADNSNNRVIYFDFNVAPGLASGRNADILLGQLNWPDTLQGTGPNRLFNPRSVWGEPNGVGLFIADSANNRVVYYPNPVTNGSATVAFGKTNLTDGSNSISPEATNLNFPYSVQATSDGDLFIVDRNWKRILLFNGAGVSPTQFGIPADAVFAQINFQNFSNSVARQMQQMAYDELTDSLWVADGCANVVFKFSNVRLTRPSPTGVGVAVEFPNRDPDFILTALDGGQRSGYQVSVDVGELREVDPNNQTVAVKQIPQLGYNTSVTVDASSSRYDFILTGTPSLTFRYFLYSTPQTIVSAGISFTTSPNDIKQTVLIGSWPFASTQNSLVLVLHLSTSNPINSISKQIYNQATLTVFTLTSTNFTTTLTLLNKAVVDGVNTPLEFSLVQQGSSSLDLTILFPYFASSVDYDPDFSVVVDGGNSGGDGGGGDGNSDLLPLLSLIALVIPATMCLAAAIFAVVMVLKRKRWRDRVSKASRSASVNL